MSSASRRFIVIAATVLILGASALVSRRLSTDEDVTALLPDTDAVIRDYRFVIKRFHALDTLYVDVGVEKAKPLDADRLTAVADAFYKRLADSDMFSMIHYRVPGERFLALLDSLHDKSGRLFTAADAAETERRIEPKAVYAGLAAAKRALIEPSGVFTRRHLLQDPLGFDESIVGKLRSLAGNVEAADALDGRIWSRDGRHILIIATPRLPSTDMPGNERLAALLAAARAQAYAAATGGGVVISCFGGHVAALDNAVTIKRDITVAMIVSTLGILLIAFFFFHRALYVPLIMLPPAFGIACATLTFGLVNPAISAISVAISAVLLGITVDCAVYIFYRIDNTAEASASPDRTVRSILLPLALVSGTQVAALLCLLFSSLPGQRQTAVFSSISVLAANAYAVVALPKLLPAGRKDAAGRTVPLARYCERFLQWRSRHEAASAAVVILLLAVGAIGLTRLRFNGDAEAMNFLRASSRAAETVLRDTWGDFASSAAVVRGKTLQEALAANDRMLAALDGLESRKVISGTSCIGRILPAAATQQANAARWSRFWADGRAATLGAEMGKALPELGFTTTAFEPFMAGLERRAAPLTLDDFTGTGIDDLLSTRIARDGDDYLILSMFSVADMTAFDAARAAIESAVPGATVANGRRFVERATDITRSELRTLSLAAGIAVALWLVVVLGRIELAVICLLPVLMSVTVTLGTLALLRIPVNLVSALFVVFVFGVGVDYSIFPLSNAIDAFRGKGKPDVIAFGSVVISALAIMCSFGALCLAKHPALFSIGMTGAVGMTSSLVCAALVVPPLAARMLPGEKRLGSPSLVTLAGALAVVVYLMSAALLYSCFLRYVAMLVSRGDVEARRRFARRYIHLMAYSLARHFPYPSSRRIWIDVDPARFEKPAVIVANHLAMVDIMLVLALPAQQVLMVKRWVWDAPVIGTFARDAGYILAGSSDFADVATRAGEILNSGVSVTVFPEGSRSPDVRMRRFHKGAFEIAARTGADVLPVLITASQSCTPRGAFWIGRHTICVRALDRVTSGAFDYCAGARALADHVKKSLEAFVEDDWRRAQAGRSFRANTRALYDYLGPFVENYVAWKLRLDPLYRCIDDLVPRKGVVLDLGCGYGLMSNVLARKAPRRRVVGVDYDERKVSAARRTFVETANTSFELADVIEWDYPAGDAVLLIDVLHYWPDYRQRCIIAKAAGALRPGGILVFRDAFASDGARHRATSWLEVFATFIGHNRSLKGLHFQNRDFYEKEFAANGLTLRREAPEGKIGSNVVLVLTKNLS